MVQVSNSVRAMFPSLLSAVGAALAMNYPRVLWPLAFIALAPLIAYLRKEGKAFRRTSALAGFCILFAVLATPWFASTYPLDWIGISDRTLSVLIIGFIWGGFAIAMMLPMLPWGMVPRVFSLPSLLVEAVLGASAWVLLEYVRSWVIAVGIYGDGALFGAHYTYYAMGYPVVNAPFLKEVLPVGGIYLASFLVVLTNYLAGGVWEVLRRRMVVRSLMPLALLVAGVGIVSAAGMYTIRLTDTRGAVVTATAIRTDLPSTKDRAMAREKSDIAAALVREAANTDGIVVVPENIDIMSPFVAKGASPDDSLARTRLLIGSIPDKESHKMYFFTPENVHVLYYDKQLLMPIGEYSVSWVRWVLERVAPRAWRDMYEATVPLSPVVGKAGVLYRDEAVEGLVLAGSICGENVSPHLYRDATLAGATMFVNVASLSPFRNSAVLSEQTILGDAARALENGRYMIVASNANKSFIVDDRGVVVASVAGAGVHSFVEALVQVKIYPTPYVRYGDYPLYGAALALLLACVWFPRERKPAPKSGRVNVT